MGQLSLAGAPPEPKAPKSVAYRHRPAAHRFEIGRFYAPVADVLGDLATGEIIHAAWMADWGAEAITAHVLAGFDGPADLTMATFSIEGDAGEQWTRAIKAGRIRSIAILFDPTYRVQSVPVIAALGQLLPVRCYLARCHSKVYLLGDGTRFVTIAGSCNPQSPERPEVVTVAEGRELYEFHRAWIEAAMADADPYEELTG